MNKPDGLGLAVTTIALGVLVGCRLYDDRGSDVDCPPGPGGDCACFAGDEQGCLASGCPWSEADHACYNHVDAGLAASVDAPPPCSDIDDEADCAARGDCSVVSEGIDCTTPSGAACLSGDSDCTCASYVFGSCASKGSGS